MSVYEYSAKTLDGEDKSLSDFAGQVLVIVNVASKCGFTPQYEGLEALYRTYKDRGFSVLGFPCNQFGAQEAGSADEIATFCTTVYDVTFPLFAKVDVNGRNAHPLFKWLRDAAPGILGLNDVKWNFTKFLIGRDGKAVRRFSPDTEPAAIAKDIEALL